MSNIEILGCVILSIFVLMFSLKFLFKKFDIYIKKLIYSEVTRALADFQLDEMKTL